MYRLYVRGNINIGSKTIKNKITCQIKGKLSKHKGSNEDALFPDKAAVIFTGFSIKLNVQGLQFLTIEANTIIPWDTTEWSLSQPQGAG